MARKIDFALNLNGPQYTSYGWLFDESGKVRTRRTVFLPWGRGVGKSWFRRQVWWTLVAAYERKLRPNCPKRLRGVRITSMMPTLKQFRDVHWADLEGELTGDGPWAWLGAKLDRQTCQITFPGGSWLKPFPAAAYNARTSRGMRTDVLDADECDDIDTAVYDSVATPWLSEPWSLGIELPGGTPTRGRHGLWWRMLESTRLGRRIRKGEIGDADVLKMPAAQAIREVFEKLPAEEWPPGLPLDADQATIAVLRSYYGLHATYRDAPETVSALAVARAKATTPKPTFQREWEADPDAGEGLVYPFDETFHVRTAPLESTFNEFLVGADHGWVDPGVLLLIGIQGHGLDATAWILDEWYESECPNGLWDARAKAWSDDYRAKFWPDPSRPDRINDFKRQGCRLGESDNNVLGGISRVADLLFIRTSESGDRWARLYVAPNCVNTIREFGLYRRKKRPDGTFDDEPEDKHNHAMDAGRYALVGRFGRGPNQKTITSGR
jgi:hypothetical protein